VCLYIFSEKARCGTEYLRKVEIGRLLLWPSMRIRVTKIRFVLTLILAIFLLISFYLYASNKIQSEYLFPWEANSFQTSVNLRGASDGCFVIHPAYFSFDSENYRLTVSTFVDKICESRDTELQFVIHGLDSYREVRPEAYIKSYMDEDNPHDIIFELGTSNMKVGDGQTIRIFADVKYNFFNSFDFDAPSAGVGYVQIFFDSGIRGYFCETDCITVVGDYEYEEGALWRGNNKEFHFKNVMHVSLQASPKSKLWFFVQLMLDALVLGLVVVLLFEFLSIIVFDPLKSAYLGNQIITIGFKSKKKKRRKRSKSAQ